MGITQWVPVDPGIDSPATRPYCRMVQMSLDPRKTYGPAWLVLTPQGLAELRVEPDDEVSLVTVAPVEQETVERSRDPLAYGLS